MPNPTRHHVNAPVKAPASSTWLAGGGGGARRGGPVPAEGPTCRDPSPRFPLCPGRGLCPSLLGDALPGARLVGRAGGARD